MKTLLLTSCIQPSGSTPGKTLDQLFLETRNGQYLYAAQYYIEQSQFSNIVICDNSNYNFNNSERDVIRNLAVACNKQLELLSFDGNKKSHIYGYGYGEAEIFDYAFENSKLLQEAKNGRYKITGRYIIQDINIIINKTQNHECFFQKQGLLMSPFTVSTAIFKVSNSVYKKYLYKKQLNLYQNLAVKNYKNQYYLQDHFPLERVWYCLLYSYLLFYYKSIPNIFVVYFFPKTYTHGASPRLRNLIYRIYIGLWGSQFGWFHRMIHYVLFNRTYKQAIDDNLF